QLRHIGAAQLFAFLIETEGLMAAGAAEGVDRLVRGDRVQPRSHRPALFILANLGKHLKEGVLENVVREFAVAQVAAQVAVQFAFVAAHQHAERLALASAEGREQVLVRTVNQGIGIHSMLLYQYAGAAEVVRGLNSKKGRPKSQIRSTKFENSSRPRFSHFLDFFLPRALALARAGFLAGFFRLAAPADSRLPKIAS